MARGLLPAVEAAATAEVVARTVAVELDFPSGYVRINGSPSTINLGGADFLGVGSLGAITVIDESSELRAYDMSIALSAVPRDLVAVALGQAYQGRRGQVYEVLFNRTTMQPLVNPILIFRGRMDQMDIRLGETATVSVRLLNRLADWEKPRLRRYTDQEQQRRHPGDLGLRFVTATAEKVILWPGPGFASANKGLYS